MTASTAFLRFSYLAAAFPASMLLTNIIYLYNAITFAIINIWRHFQSVDCEVRHKGSKKRMSFTIVGIGASAGGLESFSELIARIPAGTGMAYVFVHILIRDMAVF
jgi:chemotaxis response regulator CheB